MHILNPKAFEGLKPYLLIRFSGDKPENRLAAKVPLLRWIPSRVASQEVPTFVRIGVEP